MRIENQAVLFALLSKYTILEKGEEGRNVIQEGMVRYGRERGARMAENARKNGDPIALWTDQAYGEWVPDYPGQMEFGTLETEPRLKTYISKCAWCEAWQKYGLLEYGKEYCVHVDAAVYDGFLPGAVCTPTTTAMSFGGERCEFDWGLPLTKEEQEMLAAKKAEIGTTFTRDFEFHTAHIYWAITATLRKRFPEDADLIIGKAVSDYIDLFGQEEFDPVLEYSETDF